MGARANKPRRRMNVKQMKKATPFLREQEMKRRARKREARSYREFTGLRSRARWLAAGIIVVAVLAALACFLPAPS